LQALFPQMKYCAHASEFHFSRDSNEKASFFKHNRMCA
jgi:hypothetical protein